MTIAEMFDLSGKTALVTGSSRGIGKSIAMTLGLAGAKVIFHGSKPSEKLDAAVEEAKKEGIACDKAICDLSNEAATKAFAAAMDVPDILVLNASMQTYMGFEDFTTEEYEKEYSANVKANFILLQRALPAMKER
ncbi:MAG: SDR family NAD(P)-dependent oxidoreductase, partial [Victivallales bacterium]|nr:SDR family NAD(P)-dependent oxidoreductase [Victivallales bacterium]